jgi:hypothetical protein
MTKAELIAQNAQLKKDNVALCRILENLKKHDDKAKVLRDELRQGKLNCLAKMGEMTAKKEETERIVDYYNKVVKEIMAQRRVQPVVESGAWSGLHDK